MDVMMYHISYISAMGGLTGNVGLYSSSIQYVINVVMTVPALLYIDRWGRRRTLLYGCISMMTFMYANAGLTASYGRPAPSGGLHGIPQESWEISGAPSRAVIACTFLLVASFACSMGPASWIYPPELFPLRVRGKGVSLCTSANVSHLQLLSEPTPTTIYPYRHVDTNCRSGSSISLSHTSSHKLLSTSNGGYTYFSVSS